MREDSDKQAIENILKEKPLKVKKHKGRPKRVIPEGVDPSTIEGTNKSIKDPLMEPYYVSMDKHGFSVFEVIQPIDLDSKPYEQSIGHYSTFDACLTSIAKKKMNSKSYDSLQSYIEEYKQLLLSFLNITNFEFKR